MPRITAGMLVALCLAGQAPAQTVRVVDADGVVHYTNTPCEPKYLRIAPAACPAAAPAPAASALAPAPSRQATLAPATIASGLSGAIAHAAGRHGVDPRLVEVVIEVESGGNPGAVSPKGAQGLMQLMPARAAALGIRDPFDPHANIEGGVSHLRTLLTRYGGDLSLALAAYNAGEHAVERHGGIPPYPETQAYVRRVLRRYGDPGEPTRSRSSAISVPASTISPASTIR